MEDLADGVGLVAVLLEVLRQRGEVAGDIAPVRVKVVEFRGVGSPGRKFCCRSACIARIENTCVSLNSDSRVVYTQLGYSFEADD